MKKKFLALVMLISAGVALTSCSWFETPANAERLGTGYIQYDKGVYFVEIDSLCFVPDFVYANSSGRDGKNRMDAVDGMLVTCFRLHGNQQVDFIAGDHSEEYLETYFTTNYTLVVIFVVILGLLLLAVLLSALKRKVVHTD